MDKDIKIEDCPFCGKKADLTHTSSILGGEAIVNFFSVGCSDCGISFKSTRIDMLKDGKEYVKKCEERNEKLAVKAIQAWNRRFENA